MKIFPPITLSLILLFSISRESLYSQEVDHYETIILPGSTCKYMIPTSDIGHGWRSADYDDSSWSTMARRVMTIEILDIRGVTVERITDHSPDPGYNVYKLPDLSYLSKGIYLIRISDGERLLHIEKLIKQK